MVLEISMAECQTCKKKTSSWFHESHCKDCQQKHAKELTEKNRLAAEARVEAKESQKASRIEESAQVNAIMITTETAPNLNIKSRVGIIMADADCAFDVAMIKNKDALLSNLKSEAHSIGANAVVGVTFNMIETYSASIGIGKVNTFKLIAYGTAVIIETEEGTL
jgi:hypothetical protein